MAALQFKLKHCIDRKLSIRNNFHDAVWDCHQKSNKEFDESFILWRHYKVYFLCKSYERFNPISPSFSGYISKTQILFNPYQFHYMNIWENISYYLTLYHLLSVLKEMFSFEERFTWASLSSQWLPIEASAILFCWIKVMLGFCICSYLMQEDCPSMIFTFFIR